MTLLGGAAAAWPLVVEAQQPKVSRLGWLTTAPAADVNPFLDANDRAGQASWVWRSSHYGSAPIFGR
jgi:hypothetical protein